MDISRLLKKCFLDTTAAAKAGDENKPVTAALKHCATQNQARSLCSEFIDLSVQWRVFRRTSDTNIALRLVTLFTALSFATGIAHAQSEFSADIVNLTHPDNPFQTKVYSTKNRLRFEGRDSQGRTGSIMIVDLATRHSIVLMPQQRMYVEQSRPQIPGQGVSFFQAKDVDDACVEWQKVAEEDFGKCSKAGSETVNDRPTVKYEAKSADGETTSVWIDARLHFPVKWAGPVGSGELRNIQEGVQPEALFSIPAGYKKRGFSKVQPAP